MTKNEKRTELRQSVDCRVRPKTRDMIERVARMRKTSIGRSVDYLVELAVRTILLELRHKGKAAK